jgi:DNA-binding MarR family transcriptional regulator
MPTQDEPDLAILLAAAFRALTVRLAEANAEAGVEGLRPSFGYAIRAIHAERPTVRRLAELLDVTKQTASTLADDLRRAGFVERRPDEEDRRRVRLVLTAQGRAVRERALRTSAELEQEITEATDERSVRALRATLLALVERHGGLEDVMARRPKAPR